MIHSNRLSLNSYYIYTRVMIQPFLYSFIVLCIRSDEEISHSQTTSQSPAMMYNHNVVVKTSKHKASEIFKLSPIKVI